MVHILQIQGQKLDAFAKVLESIRDSELLQEASQDITNCEFNINPKGKKTGEHEIELIGFDTADEIIPLAETEVCRLSQIATGKPCDSINKAFGGYGKGQDKVKEIVKKYFNDLYKAGFGITSIAHTKVKNIIEKGREDSEGYQVLTSNLPNLSTISLPVTFKSLAI